MKDNFSKQSHLYAQYRPEYPDELYQHILSYCISTSCVWDCATGNGQVAKVLSKHFDKVEATDISQKQLDSAFQSSIINYSISAAENTSFPDNHFDLVTVAQALHWFDFGAFFNEVKRVLKPTGILAVWGYSSMKVNVQIDPFIHDFYHNIIGSYWDDERKHIDNQYTDIHFPFKQVETVEFEIKTEWDLPTLKGFFNTWSSVQHFINEEGYNPVNPFINRLETIWKKSEVKTITFPIFLKLIKK